VRLGLVARACTYPSDGATEDPDAQNEERRLDDPLQPSLLYVHERCVSLHRHQPPAVGCSGLRPRPERNPTRFPNTAQHLTRPCGNTAPMSLHGTVYMWLCWRRGGHIQGVLPRIRQSRGVATGTFGLLHLPSVDRIAAIFVRLALEALPSFPRRPPPGAPLDVFHMGPRRSATPTPNPQLPSPATSCTWRANPRCRSSRRGSGKSFPCTCTSVPRASVWEL